MVGSAYLTRSFNFNFNQQSVINTMRTIDTGTSFLTLEEFISHLEQNFRQHDYVQGIDLDGVYYADRPGVGRVVQFAPEKQELKTLRYVVSELLDGGMDIDDLAEYLQLTGVEI